MQIIDILAFFGIGILGISIGCTASHKKITRHENDRLRCIKENKKLKDQISKNTFALDSNSLVINYLVTLNDRHQTNTMHKDKGIYKVTKLIFRKDNTIAALLTPAVQHPESIFCCIRSTNAAYDISWLDFHSSYTMYKMNKE